MDNLDRYQSIRLTPSQTRGKERVRRILAASLSLFKERGVEETTTNEIAARAGIPIGSLYRYYPNKDAIIRVLTDLYIDDLSAIFADIAAHPLYMQYSWNELLFMLLDTWVHYSRMNGSFAFLYAERGNPRLRSLNAASWRRFTANFTAVLRKRCADITDREAMVCLQMAVAASELGINGGYEKELGENLHYEAVEAIAAYLQLICRRHKHDDM